MKALSRLLIAAIAPIMFLLALSTNAHAGGEYAKEFFTWQIKLGTETDGRSLSVVRSYPNREVQLHSGVEGSRGWENITASVTGVNYTFPGSYREYDLKNPQAQYPFATASWDSSVCPNGPQLTFSKSSNGFKVLVQNTTDYILYLSNRVNDPGYIVRETAAIAPSEWWTTDLAVGSLMMFHDPEMRDMNQRCAFVVWYAPTFELPAPPALPTATPTMSPPPPQPTATATMVPPSTNTPRPTVTTTPTLPNLTATLTYDGQMRWARGEGRMLRLALDSNIPVVQWQGDRMNSTCAMTDLPGGFFSHQNLQHVEYGWYVNVPTGTPLGNCTITGSVYAAGTGQTITFSTELNVVAAPTPTATTIPTAIPTLPSGAISVSELWPHVGIIQGRTANALRVTGTGATGFSMYGYPTSFGPGINWTIGSAGLTVGSSYNVGIHVNGNVPPGTYIGRVKIMVYPGNHILDYGEITVTIFATPPTATPEVAGILATHSRTSTPTPTPTRTIATPVAQPTRRTVTLILPSGTVTTFAD